MAKTKSRYVCQSCGHVSPRYVGQCPECAEWNTYVEEKAVPAHVPAGMTSRTAPRAFAVPVQRLQDIALETDHRLKTGIGEFDRVLGGGIMKGAFTLIAGDPGIGKSTLMTLLPKYLPDKRVLYVTGEESLRQVKVRAERLGVHSAGFMLLAETDVDQIAATIQQERPDVVVIDSIQTLFRSDIESAPGSVSQVRESAATLLHLTKSLECATFLVGHVTKSGQVAGPRVLEHMVDTVLYFEGDRHHSYRVLRAVKNRFGATNEMGVFEMAENGLVEVDNPSAFFLSQRSYGASGSAVVSALEGTRPLLVEVQALVAPTAYPSPQRTTTGFDSKRLQMLLAVLERRADVRLGAMDVFVNLAGGLRLEEPAIDLGVLVAVASAKSDIPADSTTVCIGEVGLGGEIRSVSQLPLRLREAARLGFQTALVPKHGADGLPDVPGLTLRKVEHVSEALGFMLG